ncbi:hypothetical protein [Sulfuracidifex metallicus]|uniref:hypothetical protein n=1 Tax=Sulfuracidifex metallicus TaxID=47303 RepID=UPI0022766707|nr:hypothetical protein [Sulfuracidifex metallicus]MCY0851026.1 hypothetical protein [Sulfuracidifex metallicus]
MKCDDAEFLLIAMGAWVGDIRVAVNRMRNEGKKEIGLLKIRVFRPFPKEEVNDILMKKRNVSF